VSAASDPARAAIERLNARESEVEKHPSEAVGAMLTLSVSKVVVLVRYRSLMRRRS